MISSATIISSQPMDTYEVTGTLKVVGGIQSFPSGFTKRQIVIETHDKYPQQIAFELFKENTELTNGLNAEDMIRVSFNLRGNEYNGKYYVNLQAWRIAPLPKAQASQAHQAPAQTDWNAIAANATPQASQPAAAVTSDEDEIPF